MTKESLYASKLSPVMDVISGTTELVALIYPAISIIRQKKVGSTIIKDNFKITLFRKHVHRD